MQHRLLSIPVACLSPHRCRRVSEATAPAGLMGLPSQLFSENPLDRSSGNKKSATFLNDTLPTAKLLLLTQGRKVAIKKQEEGGDVSLAWVAVGELEGLGMALGADEGEGSPLSPYVLGQVRGGGGGWRYAVDLDADLAQQAVEKLGLEMSELRPLMFALPHADAAVAGQATALANWHSSVRFCGSCGEKTMAIEAGLKRQCASCGRRVYPRTDPVVIMIAESPDGERCLLGRVKKFRPGTYTALAGFIEQGESIEEAVSRELLEESAVPVERVRIVGSQPWPPGRGGTCELMLGAVVKATSDEIVVNRDEMDDVRWFTRSQVLAAVARSTGPDNPINSLNPVMRPGEAQGAAEDPDSSFWVPGPYAIAYWLIKGWAENTLHPSSSAKL